MTPEAKKYLKGGLILLAVGAGMFGIWKIYKKVEKNILDKKLRESQSAEPKLDLPPSVEKTTTEKELKTAVGKKVYPKGNYVIVRDSPDINNGRWNNVLGAVYQPKLVGTVLESTISGGFVWYKIAPQGQNFVTIDVGGFGKVSIDKNARTGYVREDVVTLK